MVNSPKKLKIIKAQRHIKIFFNNAVIGDTINPLLVLDLKPVYYLPYENVKTSALQEAGWENTPLGQAVYYDLEVKGKKVEKACWRFEDVLHEYRELKNMIAFDPAKVDAFYINGELYIDYSEN